MNFARPATGFIMVEPASFKELLQNHAGKMVPRDFALGGYQGPPEDDRTPRGSFYRGNPSNRVFEAEGDIASELPTIRVAYHVLGDRLDFKMLVVLDPPS
jgi:hypothetical protein